MVVRVSAKTFTLLLRVMSSDMYDYLFGIAIMYTLSGLAGGQCCRPHVLRNE